MKMRNEYLTLREEVVKYLRDKIITGDIEQGQRIIEANIQSELGISRGPVREALRQLEGDGLVEYKPRKGCTVKIITAKDAEESYVMRTALENLSVRLCNGHFSEETIVKMKEIVAKLEQFSNINDIINIVEYDERFHELIIREINNDKLYEMWSSLSNLNAMIFYKLYKSPYSPNELLGHNHEILVESIENGKVDTICNEIQYHYMIVAKNLYKEENKEVEFDFKL